MSEKKWDDPKEMLPFFQDLDGGDGPPEEKWRREGDFDPPFLRGQLQRYAQKGWIELDRTLSGLSELRFRFTPSGRNQFEALVEGGKS